jgi:GDPmannose 4,6-dehydratase
LCDLAFNIVGLNYLDFVVKDEKFIRPEELNVLKGDATKLKKATGWNHSYTFEQMIQEMIEYWLVEFQK